MEQREGYIEHIKFRNPDNGYTIFQLSEPGGNDELTCVGNFPAISEGEYVKVEGAMTVHVLYGEQLQVSSYEICVPKDRLAVERYLGSGAIKGIGQTMAARIVRKFGDDTFRIIEREPERLAEIRGISDRMARDIHAQFKEKQGMREAMMYLQQYNISGTLAVKIYKQYGEKMRTVLEENPYQMTEDIPGVGFKTADSIAERMGISGFSPERIRAGLVYALQLAAQARQLFADQAGGALRVLCRAAEGFPEAATAFPAAQSEIRVLLPGLFQKRAGLLLRLFRDLPCFRFRPLHEPSVTH